MPATLSDAPQSDPLLLQRQAKRRSWSTVPLAIPVSTTPSGPDVIYSPVASRPTSLDFDHQNHLHLASASPPSSSPSSSGRTSPISTSSFFHPESIDGLLGHPTSGANAPTPAGVPPTPPGIPTSSSPAPYYHRRINSLMLAGQRSRTPDSFYNVAPSSPALAHSSNPSLTSLSSSTGSSISSASTIQEKRSSLGRTRSLHASSNSPGGAAASKRWSSSVIMDPHHGLSSPRPLHLQHRRNSSLGISYPSTPFLTEQERLLQEKLQELARSENARLNDGTNPNNTTTTSTSNASSAAASVLSSPLVSSYSSSSAGTSPRSSFQSSPNAPNTSSTFAGPKPIVPPTAPQSNHYRHLSLQSYYNTTNNRAPDMLASTSIASYSAATPTATQSLGGHTLSSAVSGFPTLPASSSANFNNNYANVFNNNNNANPNSYRPMSPRTAARAAALASLNAADDFPTSTARSFSRRSSSASSSGSIFLPSGVAGARTSSVLSESGASSGVLSPSPPASPSISRRYARHSTNNNLHGFQTRKGSFEICEGEATSTVPDGYYIISASDLERLRRMEHVEEFGSLVETRDVNGKPGVSSSLSGRSGSRNGNEGEGFYEDGTPVVGPQRPGNIGGTVLSWRMTGDLMRTWMTAYKSPSAVIDLVQFVWATVSNGAAVREELRLRAGGKPAEYPNQSDEEEDDDKNQGLDEEAQDEDDATNNNATSLFLPPKDVVEGLRDAVVLQVARAGQGARGVAQVVPVARAAGNAVLQATVDWACVGLAMNIIFIQVVLLGVMTIAFLLGDAIVYPVRKARKWYCERRTVKTRTSKQGNGAATKAKSASKTTAGPEEKVAESGLSVDKKEAAIYETPVVLVRRLTRRRAETESSTASSKSVDESHHAYTQQPQGPPEESMQVRAKRAALKKAKRRSRY